MSPVAPPTMGLVSCEDKYSRRSLHNIIHNKNRAKSPAKKQACNL